MSPLRRRERVTETAPDTAPAAVEEQRVVWRGADALRPFLIPIETLAPFPGNPRRGDVETVRQSLRRWGQTRPILTDANADDGRRVVAGHHVREAAAAEGWTHVAAIPNEFRDEEDARGYLLADNRTHDLGNYDFDLLYQQIKRAQEQDNGLFGTGYSDDFVAMLDKEMVETITDVMAPPEFPEVDPATMVTQHRCPSCGYEWSGNPAPGANGAADGDGDGE
jgi:hypothetical protein